jgi:hypothetical protein
MHAWSDLKEVEMQKYFGTVLIMGFLAASTLDAVPTKRTAVVRFLNPTSIAGTFVLGTVVIEHDDDKMAHGQPCTTVYRFKSRTELGEPIVSFMCMPQERALATKFEATLYRSVASPDRLIEYQISGEREGHGVPDFQ